MPFGLNLKLGDVVSVNRNGTFNLEGTSASLLSRKVGKVRQPQPANVNLMRQSGSDTSLKFRTKGSASTLFENLPTANAGFDISFGSASGWMLAFTGRAISAIEELDTFRGDILGAYWRGVWKPDWALVTSVSTVERMTLLASSTSGTNVALALNGQFDPASPIEVQLTAEASIVATNHELIQCVTTEKITAFCSAVRVRDRWWSHPEVVTLEKHLAPDIALTASSDDFWESVDIPG